MVDVFIAVGSNIEPEYNILQALVALSRVVKIEDISTFYRTEPINRPEQPSFYNGVWRIKSNTPARKLKFVVLRPIESSLGRVRTKERYAPRPIDLDIILYGNQIMNEPGLIIPDPDILKRPFIARPLLEIAPDLIVPGTHIPLSSTEASKADNGLEPLWNFSNRLREKIKI